MKSAIIKICKILLSILDKRENSAISRYDDLYKQLQTQEGLRLKLYKCTAGKLTIGIGHNIEDRGITERHAIIIFKDDVESCIKDVKNCISFYNKLDHVRQDILINMTFNIGIKRLLKFKKMLTALESGDYKTAYKEMLDSKWHEQVGNRAEELSIQMLKGEYND